MVFHFGQIDITFISLFYLYEYVPEPMRVAFFKCPMYFWLDYVLIASYTSTKVKYLKSSIENIRKKCIYVCNQIYIEEVNNFRKYQCMFIDFSQSDITFKMKNYL